MQGISESSSCLSPGTLGQPGQQSKTQKGGKKERERGGERGGERERKRKERKGK